MKLFHRKILAIEMSLLLCTSIIQLEQMESILVLGMEPDVALQDTTREKENSKEPEQSYLTIHTVEELLAFASNCTLDTYSENMKVLLDADLNLTGQEFQPVPVFSGSFDGGGHQITGIKIEERGSNLGFFRYIREGAEVKNLTLEIQMIPSGTQTGIGGIAGENQGKIVGCTVSGNVKGTEDVGGIAGVNRKSGTIEGCLSLAEVSGTTQTGGITGFNEGIVRRCTNEGNINPAPEEKAEDTGGIAGRSLGAVENCLNYGTIGYHHTGYNTGGIVGLLNGTIRDCENRGTIYGRKDTGGITGQFEPDISFQYGKDKVENLKTELRKLSGLITDFTSLIGDSAADGAEKIQGINQALGLAADSIQMAGDNLEETGETIYGYAQEMNDSLSNILTAAESCILTVDAELSSVSAELRTMRETFDSTVRTVSDEVSLELDQQGFYMDQLDTQMDMVDRAMQVIAADISKVERFFRSLTTILKDDSATASYKANKIREAVRVLDSLDFNTPVQQIKDSFSEISKILKEWIEDIQEKGGQGSELEEIVRQLQIQMDLVENGVTNLWKEANRISGQGIVILQNIGELAALLTGSVQEIAQAAELLNNTQFGSSLSKLSTAVNSAGKLLTDMAESLHKSYTAIDTSASEGWKTMNQSAQAFGEAIGRLGEALRDFGLQTTDGLQTVTEKIGQMEEALNALSGLNSLTSDEIYEQLDVIEEQVTGLTDGIVDLDASLRNTGDEVNRQVDRVSNSISELLTTPELTIEDISDQAETEEGTGLILNCRNFGRIDTDANAGGIAGIVATEIGLDPELDLELSSEQGFTDTTAFVKATIKNCRNDGDVSAKNDCAGGIAGRADVGAILDCISRGIITVGGSQCGGIAGRSGSMIGRSFVLCDLYGTDSLGGIAGIGTDIRDCYAMTQIESDGERLGAIAGSADGEIRENYFLEEELAGIDGINYRGKAMPLSFQEFSKIKEIPSDFLVFTVTFEENNQVLCSVPVEYNGSLDETKIPKVSEGSEGFYEWPEFDASEIRRSMVICAETYSWISSIATSENPPVLLVDGKFTPEAAVEILQWNPEIEQLPSGKSLAAGYQVQITSDEETEFYQMRLRCGSKEEVYLLQENTMQKVSGTRDGSYLVFLAKNGDQIAVVTKEGSEALWILMAAGGFGVILTAGIGLAVLKKRHKKKNRK